eukprot:1029125-Heterocapsa_arctica.AAC.1
MGLGHDLEVRQRAARRHVDPGGPHILAGAAHEAQGVDLLAAQADLVLRALLAADLWQRGDPGCAEAALELLEVVDVRGVGLVGAPGVHLRALELVGHGPPHEVALGVPDP